MRKDRLTSESLLSEIERVLQSFEEFVLDKEMERDIIQAKNPKGGVGKRCRFFDLQRFLAEKKCIIQIKNSDDLCAARAIVTAKARIDNHQLWHNIRQGRRVQSLLAKELHTQAGVSLGKCGLEEIKQFQQALPGYQIYVLSKEHFNAIIYTGPLAEKKIFLYLHDEHYDVITSLSAFMGRNYFCYKCQKGYDHRERHLCNNPCLQCHSIHDDDGLGVIHAIGVFEDRHVLTSTKNKRKGGISTCTNYFKCQQCKYVVNLTKRKTQHECGEVFCTTCRDYYPEGHQCIMQPCRRTVPELDVSKEIAYSDISASDIEEEMDTLEDDDIPRQTYIFFDFECKQEFKQQCEKGFDLCEPTNKCKNCGKAKCGSYRHEPNLCVAHKVCTMCLHEEVTSDSSCDKCGQHEYVFSGKDTLNNFCKWLFSGENNGSIAVAHNFRSYDAFPVMQYLHVNSILPKVIPNGSKIMSIEVSCCEIKMIDSLNFMPTSLSKLPAMFGLTEMKKGYCPHMFNKEENQNAILEHLPDLSYYNPEGMKVDDRETFLKWYKNHKQDQFHFANELLEYCKSDVDILRRCCLRFRELFIEISASCGGDPGVDPFEDCITIASACNLVFRRNYLKEKHDWSYTFHMATAPWKPTQRRQCNG